jgi:myosin heavy subunit
MAETLFYSQVFYDATGFLEKNRDTMSPDIIHVLRTSGGSLIITVLCMLLNPASIPCWQSIN